MTHTAEFHPKHFRQPMSSIWQLSWTLVVSFVGKTGLEPASPWLLTRPLTKPISVLPVFTSEPSVGIEPTSADYETAIIAFILRGRCGPDENRTHHGLLARESRQPWNMRAQMWERRDSNPLTLNQYATYKGNGFTDRRRYSPIIYFFS